MAEQADVQKKVKQFIELLPLTLDLAGLPKAEPGRSFTADQLEARVMAVKTAYRAARQAVSECVKDE